MRECQKGQCQAFLETVEKWREIVNKILAGQEPDPFTLPVPNGPQTYGVRPLGPDGKPAESGKSGGECCLKI